MAKAFGAAHIATACSPQHMDFVKSLGADIVVDYHKQELFTSWKTTAWTSSMTTTVKMAPLTQLRMLSAQAANTS